MKTCTLCKESKSTADFRVVKRKKAPSFHSWCKTCESDYQKRNKKPGAWKRWYDNLPEEKKQYQRQKQTNRDKIRKYGVSIDDLKTKLEAQYGACATCMTPITLYVTDDVSWSKKANIDHDHSCCPGETSCGKCIRGLLCGNCNRILGLLKESHITLTALASYLKEYSN